MELEASSQEGGTWEFTAHLFRDGTRWSWANLGEEGDKLRESRLTFSSFSDAVANARNCGFRAGERFALTAVECVQIPRRYTVSHQPAVAWPDGLAVV
jgi:hypothetical protein